MKNLINLIMLGLVASATVWAEHQPQRQRAEMPEIKPVFENILSNVTSAKKIHDQEIKNELKTAMESMSVLDSDSNRQYTGFKVRELFDSAEKIQFNSPGTIEFAIKELSKSNQLQGEAWLDNFFLRLPSRKLTPSVNAAILRFIAKYFYNPSTMKLFASFLNLKDFNCNASSVVWSSHNQFMPFNSKSESIKFLIKTYLEGVKDNSITRSTTHEIFECLYKAYFDSAITSYIDYKGQTLFQ